MHGHDIIVMGASAGGVETLKEIVRGFSADLPASVFVVIHLAPGSMSVLPAILTRAGPLQAMHARDHFPIERGTIYIAPPDFHLIVKRGHMRLGRGPRENRCRPAVDPLFRTAAAAYGSRVIGVVLSGGLDDGTAGLVAIKSSGGIAVVQDPESAMFPGMPESALRNVAVDFVAPTPKIAGLLADLATTPAANPGKAPSELVEVESDIAELQMDAVVGNDPVGSPSGFACPECGGALFELQEGALVRFRCRVGHAYSSDSLLAEQAESIEAALWTALRALEESAALSRQVAERVRRAGRMETGDRFESRAQTADAHAERIRQVLAKGQLGGEEGASTAA